MGTESLVAEIDTLQTTSTTTPPRRWAPLARFALGAALYFSPLVWLSAPETVPAMPIFMGSMWGPFLCCLLLAAWWLVRGSASWRTRWTAVGIAVALGAVAMLTADPSARFFLMMKGIPLAVAIVTVFLCFAWSVRPGLRLLLTLAVAGVALLPWQFMQFNGVTGQFGMEPQPRWQVNAEEAAAAYDQQKAPTAPLAEMPKAAGPGDWPGFRGAHQDSVVRDIKLSDWKTLPTEL